MLQAGKSSYHYKSRRDRQAVLRKHTFLGCAVVSTGTSTRSPVASAPVLCATGKLS